MILSIIIGIVISIVFSYFIITFFLPRFLEQFLNLAKEKLGAEKDEIKTDLKNKKEIIEEIAKKIREDLEKTKERLEKAERERIGSFSQLKEALENQARVTEELSSTTENLKKILSNNQLRGQFGEQVAENLLKMNGFVKGVDYQVNKEQEGSETRPDFTIFLPNKIKINVDSKFPYQNLQRMTDTENKTEKKSLLKLFERDIKEKIKQVTTRDYINPADNTVDFVILFVPNEMIFSFIYDKMNEVWAEAMRQKVVLAGPFSFTAILRLVKQAYDNFRYQKNIQKIIGYIKAFEIEFKKYNEEFLKIGERIESLTKQYHIVNTTRTNQLVRSIEKIKLEPADEKLMLLEKN
ncbi:MAG: DNA recombination protein RmuC [Patescibacteria group bacterium]|nr:DNA recombination protein RmuC [Patescibacteria group bacterium]